MHPKEKWGGAIVYLSQFIILPESFASMKSTLILTSVFLSPLPASLKIAIIFIVFIDGS